MILNFLKITLNLFRCYGFTKISLLKIFQSSHLSASISSYMVHFSADMEAELLSSKVEIAILLYRKCVINNRPSSHIFLSEQ